MKQFLRFAAVGVANTVVGYAVIFACMYLFEFSAVASNVIGYSVGLVVSYLLNRDFTFKSVAARAPELLRFVSIFLVAYLANLGVLMLLIRQLNVHEGMAQILAGMAYFALFYLLSKYYVFARPGVGRSGR